jgi:hypothetical protein
MPKHNADKKSKVTQKVHNRVGLSPQAPSAKSWGRN